MRQQKFERRSQRGFTLVELAIVLVIAGLILVAVLRGTDAIQQAQAERMVADLRGTQAMLLEFQKRNGRLPGDCDNNGVINATAPVAGTLLPGMTGTGSATVLHNDPATRSMAGTPVGASGTANAVCIDNDAAREVDINLVWNELRRAGSVDANRLPRELARHAMGDVFLVSSMRDAVAPAGQTTSVIVVYGIPVWMAEAVDASIDGTATLYGTGAGGPAATGRVRLWSGAGAAPVAGADRVFTAPTDTSYAQGGADRDRLVAISFQFTPGKLVN